MTSCPEPTYAKNGLVTGVPGDFFSLSLALGTSLDSAQRTGFFVDSNGVNIVVGGNLVGVLGSSGLSGNLKIPGVVPGTYHSLYGYATLDRDVYFPDKDGTVAYLDDIAQVQVPGTVTGAVVNWNGTSWEENTNLVITPTGGISVTELVTAEGLSLNGAVANPGGANTLWYNSGDNTLYFGADAVGIGSWLGNDNQIALGMSGQLDGTNNFTFTEGISDTTLSSTRTDAGYILNKQTVLTNISTKDVYDTYDGVDSNRYELEVTANEVTASLNSVNIYTIASSNLTYDFKVNFKPSTAGLASINIPHGVSPSVPLDGDMWTDTLGVYAVVDGTVVNLTEGNLVISPATYPEEIVSVDELGDIYPTGVTISKDSGQVAATTVIDSINVDTTVGICEWDVLLNTATATISQRVMALWDGSSVTNNEYSMLEIGTYTGAYLEVTRLGNIISLTLVVTSGTHNYLVTKQSVRAIP